MSNIIGGNMNNRGQIQRLHVQGICLATALKQNECYDSKQKV